MSRVSGLVPTGGKQVTKERDWLPRNQSVQGNERWFVPKE